MLLNDRSFYTEERLHTEDPDRVPSRSGQNLKSQFFLSFCTLTLIFGGSTGPNAFSHFDLGFCASNLISCERVAFRNPILGCPAA